MGAALRYCGRSGIPLPFLLVNVCLLVAQNSTQAPGTSQSVAKFRVQATLSYTCTVPRSIDIHPVYFDFHNDSCQQRHRVSDRKIPTLPKGPRFTNIRISGYHFIDTKDGQPSPYQNNQSSITISKTDATITASGWLEKASCQQGPSGPKLLHQTAWQAALVPEVHLVEQVEQELPAEIVIADGGNNLGFSMDCPNAGLQSLQYSIYSLQDSHNPLYTSPSLAADKPGSDVFTTLSGISLKTAWSGQLLNGKAQIRLSSTTPQ